jgi:hypothetical protein
VSASPGKKPNLASELSTADLTYTISDTFLLFRSLKPQYTESMVLEVPAGPDMNTIFVLSSKAKLIKVFYMKSILNFILLSLVDF